MECPSRACIWAFGSRISGELGDSREGPRFGEEGTESEFQVVKADNIVGKARLGCEIFQDMAPVYVSRSRRR